MSYTVEVTFENSTVEVTTEANFVTLTDVYNARDRAEAAAVSAKASESFVSNASNNATQQALVATNKAVEASESAAQAKASELISSNNAQVAIDNAATSVTKAGEAEASAINALASENATRQLFDQFGDQYLGSHSTDPTTDNTGGPLAEGNIYWNTTESVLKFYSGSAWVAPEDIATTAAATAITKAEEASASADTASTSASTATAKANEASASASSALASKDSALAAQLSAENARDQAWVAVSSLVPYSADIWDETNDTHTSEGVTTGLTEVHKNMRRCLLLDDGTVNYYLDANDSNLKEDGTPSVLTGADGQVMVEIQKCWVQAKYIQGGSSPIIKWSVSAEPKAGYVLHPAFTLGGTLKYSPELGMWFYKNPTEELDYVYVGAYDASVFDSSAGAYISGLNLDDNTTRVSAVEDKLASVAGKYPMVGLVRSDFRTLATNRGAGWEMLDFWTYSLTQILFITEYRALNTQAVIGDGNVSVSTGYLANSANQSDSPHSVAGKSNSIGNGTGSVTSTARDAAWMSYRGIENWYGNCWKWVDGVNINDRVYYVSNSGVYTDNTSVGFTQLGITAPDSSGYIRNVQANTLSFIPSQSTGGSSAIAFSDNYWQNAGWRALLVGGDARFGVFAGGFAWHANDSAALRIRSLGSRLVYKKKL